MSRALRAVLVLVAASCSSPDANQAVSLDTSLDRTPRSQAYPLEGGTLSVSSDGRWALAAQPDRGAVAVVDLSTQTLIGELGFGADDRPGRIAQAADGTFYIVLTGAGAVATWQPDAQKGHVIESVCLAPKSVAFEGSNVFVACADGQVVKLQNDRIVERWSVAPDARDIVVFNHTLYVSRFKTAQMVAVDLTGNVLQTMTPSDMAGLDGRTFSPTVGWRAVWSSNGPLLVHQQSQDTPITTDGITSATTTTPPPVPGDCSSASPYNGLSCGLNTTCDRPVVNTVITELGKGGSGTTHFVGGAVGVDVAYDPQTGTVAVASAGSNAVMTSQMTTPSNTICDPGFVVTPMAARPVAVAFTPGGLTLVQTRNPSSLVVLHGGPAIALPNETESAGFNMFHTEATPRGIACASCHPAGLEDGHTWQFVPQGARRTQALAGGISTSAPYHWDGAFNDMTTLLQEVMVNRMGGAPVDAAVQKSLMTWLDAIPAPAPVRAAEDAAALRGRALFARADVGCATCHLEPRPSVSFDVGTGRTRAQAFQVPSLKGVAARMPLMHDGCATTLAGRFDPSCGGGVAHGNAGLLNASEQADLIAYLESL
jgi:hypothetical protein